MYIVIRPFADVKDNYHRYSVGDEFPHADIDVSEKRINELLSDNNRQKQPLIKAAAEKGKGSSE